MDVTLAAILTAARLKADNIRLTDAQLLPVANMAHTALHNLLADAIADFKLKSGTFNSVSGTGDYLVATTAADFFMMRGLELKVGTGADDWIDVDPYQWKDRNRYRNQAMVGIGYNGPTYLYRLQGANINLKPTPVAVDTFRLWWTPTAYQFTSTADATAIDGIDGWEDFIVNRVARVCLINEQQDTSAIDGEQAEIVATIQKLKAKRDSGAPRIVAAASDLDDENYSRGYGRW